MFAKLKANLNSLMSDMRISAEELARRTQVPASTIKKLRNQDNPNPTVATLQPLAEFFSLSLSQLAGEEPMPTERTKGAYRANQQTFRHLPLLSWHDAVNAPSSLSKATQFIHSEHASNNAAYALLVEEDNWENLSPGTTLIVDPELQAEHRDLVVVYRKGQLPSVKQILMDEGHTYLKPLVPGYQIAQLTDDHTILGVIIEYKKQLKHSPSKNYLKEHALPT